MPKPSPKKRGSHRRLSTVSKLFPNPRIPLRLPHGDPEAAIARYIDAPEALPSRGLEGRMLNLRVVGGPSIVWPRILQISSLTAAVWAPPRGCLRWNEGEIRADIVTL
jgi:hypothetical protein